MPTSSSTVKPSSSGLNGVKKPKKEAFMNLTTLTATTATALFIHQDTINVQTINVANVDTQILGANAKLMMMSVITVGAGVISMT